MHTHDKPVTFACVWTGDGAPYSEEWVQKLKRGVERHYPHPHRFVCLTDRDSIEGVETIKLEHDWPIYWAKMELFKPEQFEGTVVYMDLDVLITGSIEPFVRHWDSLMMLTDFYPDIGNSTLMIWDADDSFYHGLYNDMVANSEQIQHAHRNRWPVINFGDQEFIDNWLAQNGRPHKRWQDLLDADMFCEFSYTAKINPVIAKLEWPMNMRFCYCLGAPKFDKHRDHPLVKAHWV